MKQHCVKLLLLLLVMAVVSTQNILVKVGVSGQSSSKMIYTTVKENQAKFVTIPNKVYFTWYLKSGIVNMTLGNPDLVDPVTVSSMYNSIGTIKITDVVEVNDTYTNLYLEFSNSAAADTVLSSININSWNAVKKSGIVLATDKAPNIPTAPPKAVLFGGIIAIATIFSAAVSAFVVRRMALSKQDKAQKTKKDIANLEAQLIKDQIKNMGGSEKLLSSRNNKKFGEAGEERPGTLGGKGGGGGGPYDYDNEMQADPGNVYGAPPQLVVSPRSNKSESNFDARSQKSGVSRKSRKSQKSQHSQNPERNGSSRREREIDDEEERDEVEDEEDDLYSHRSGSRRYEDAESRRSMSSRAPTETKSAKSNRNSRKR